MVNKILLANSDLIDDARLGEEVPDDIFVDFFERLAALVAEVEEEGLDFCLI